MVYIELAKDRQNSTWRRRMPSYPHSISSKAHHLQQPTWVARGVF